MSVGVPSLSGGLRSFIVKAMGYAIDPEVLIPVQPLMYVTLVERLTRSLCFLTCPMAPVDLPSECGVFILTN